MRFVLRRLGFFLLTLWAALTLNFFLPRLMPGNPALAMIGEVQRAGSARRRSRRSRRCSASTRTRP